jgi:hypothetical protein
METSVSPWEEASWQETPTPATASATPLHTPGKAEQVDPIKPKLKLPGTTR